MDSMGAIDLGFKGRKYIWENKQERIALIKELLDRAIACKDWLELQSFVSVQHLRMESSYHCPIIIQKRDKEMVGKVPLNFFKLGYLMNPVCQ